MVVLIGGLAVVALVMFVAKIILDRRAIRRALQKPRPDTRAPRAKSAEDLSDGALAPTVYVNPGLFPDVEPPAELCDHDPPDFIVLLDGSTIYFRGAPPSRPLPPTLTVEINQLGRPPRAQIFKQKLIGIGRLESHLLLDDAQVSRLHAVVTVSDADGKAYITDLGSKNGTFVNGGRINTRRLNNGDIVDLGNTRLVIRITPPKDTPDTPSEA
ncbi:MAG: FHA domain-containing protein [Patescibacteria group bacterium]